MWFESKNAQMKSFVIRCFSANDCWYPPPTMDVLSGQLGWNTGVAQLYKSKHHSQISSHSCMHKSRRCTYVYNHHKVFLTQEVIIITFDKHPCAVQISVMEQNCLRHYNELFFHGILYSLRRGLNLNIIERVCILEQGLRTHYCTHNFLFSFVINSSTLKE